MTAWVVWCSESTDGTRAQIRNLEFLRAPRPTSCGESFASAYQDSLVCNALKLGRSCIGHRGQLPRAQQWTNYGPTYGFESRGPRFKA